MQILHFSLTPLVGAPMSICRALSLHEGVSSRFAVFDTCGGSYDRMVFDTDLQWTRDRDEIVELARTADIIHLHNFLDLDSQQFQPINFRQLWNDERPMVRHFHSSPEAIAHKMPPPMQTVINCPIPKLVIAQFQSRYFPNAKVVPNIVFDNDPNLSIRPRDTTLRIGYAPTRFNSGCTARWD